MEFTIIESRPALVGFVILCHLPENPVTPWATWRAQTADGQGRESGHYFYEGEEALAREDFETR